MTCAIAILIDLSLRSGALRGEASPASGLCGKSKSPGHLGTEPTLRGMRSGRRSICCRRGLQFSLGGLQDRGIFILLPRQWRCHWDIFDLDCVRPSRNRIDGRILLFNC